MTAHSSANRSSSWQRPEHLHALAEAGLARSTREGREQIREIEPRCLAAAGRYLEQISKQWDDAIERLRAFVETDD